MDQFPFDFTSGKVQLGELTPARSRENGLGIDLTFRTSESRFTISCSWRIASWLTFGAAGFRVAGSAPGLSGSSSLRMTFLLSVQTTFT